MFVCVCCVSLLHLSYVSDFIRFLLGQYLVLYSALLSCLDYCFYSLVFFLCCCLFIQLASLYIIIVSTRCKQLFVACFCCRNLPLSIVISITAIFVLYVSANFSYFVVLGVDGVLQSEAVATVRFRQFVILNCICEMDFVLVDLFDKFCMLSQMSNGLVIITDQCHC